MIVGSYNLDLICDNDAACPYGRYYDGDGERQFPKAAQFSGETGEKARKEARRAGWRVLLSKDLAYCPGCSAK